MNARILVVDDSTLARRTLRKVLEESGYEVEEAADGAQALERYFVRPHDLVLLDLVMEQMCGIEVLTKFRELNPKVKVIVATADIQSSTRAQVRQAGAVGLINKPFTRDEVLRVVEAALKGEGVWN